MSVTRETTSFRTKQEEAYVRLRSDILAGRLLPGTKLRFAELGARYDLSIGVLREALSRLLEQGLVESSPQQGFRVTAISQARLVQLTTARAEIETLTLRHAISEGGVAWEADVLASHHRLASTPFAEPGDPDRISEEWARLHADFHHTLLAGCANEYLIDIAGNLRDAAELYRRWSVPLGDRRAKRDIAGEHSALLDAVLIRDADRATAVLERHILLTTELLIEAGVFADEPPTRRAGETKFRN